MPLTAELIIAIIGALTGITGAAVAAVVSLRKAKPEMKKIAAEADEIQSRTWSSLTGSLEASIATLSRQIADQRAEIAALRQAKLETEKGLEKRINDLDCELSKLREAKERTDEENDKLRARIRTLEEEVHRIPAMELEIKSLREQIIELGGKPKTGPLGAKVN